MKPTIMCQICGAEIVMRDARYGGRVCGEDCSNELEWRKVLSITGSDYKPQPPRKCKEILNEEERSLYKRLCENAMVALSWPNERDAIAAAERMINYRIVRSVRPTDKPSQFENHRVYEAIPPVNNSLWMQESKQEIKSSG
jgi:rRNA maturation endonuclease Nob1